MHPIKCIISNPEPECSRTDTHLVNGDTQNSGTVQTCHNGYWGSVCGYDWDDTDAIVVCRQLGFSPISKCTTLPVARLHSLSFLWFQMLLVMWT